MDLSKQLNSIGVIGWFVAIGSGEKMDETTTCNICGCELSENEIYILHERKLCKDCHMVETHPVKVCNPLPVITARKIGNTSIDPKDTLNELQKAIYIHIVDNKKATVQQLCTEFELTEAQLTNQVAVLRHLQLIKGKKANIIKCFFIILLLILHEYLLSEMCH